MADKPFKIPIYLRTAAKDRRKALAHYQDLKHAGKSKRAVVISEDAAGAVTILGQMLTLDEITRLLIIAAEAITYAEDQRQQHKREPHEEPIHIGDFSVATIPERAITLNADGIMVPPPGETIISCGQCHHPRWYVLFSLADESPARFACAHCGNEIVVHRILHPPGKA